MILLHANSNLTPNINSNLSCINLVCTTLTSNLYFGTVAWCHLSCCYNRLLEGPHSSKYTITTRICNSKLVVRRLHLPIRILLTQRIGIRVVINFMHYDLVNIDSGLFRDLTHHASRRQGS